MHFTFNFTRRNNEREKLETGLCRLSKSNFKVFFITILRIKRAEEADFGMELAFNLRRYIERKNWKYFEVIFQIPISRSSS